jgi:endonuclease/exonuclease/phosphatase family metal-dependent hydrolase
MTRRICIHSSPRVVTYRVPLMTDLPNRRTSRWRAVAIGLGLILIGLVIWDGANRRSADATRPILQCPSSQAIGSAPKTLKLGSFNIHSGKGTDGVTSLARTAQLLSDLDFVGLYEVRGTSEGTQSNQAAALASLCEAGWLFAPTEHQWWSDHFGNGLMFQVPVRPIIRIPLVNTRGKAYRNAILTAVELEEITVRVIAVHIDRESDRQHQLQTVIDLFLSLQAPCVLMGDLNSTASDPLLVALREQPGVQSPLHEMLAEGPPSQGIDWIFTRGLKTISATLVENTASDHPLVKAELGNLNQPE